jgi:hypothetical protein
MAPGLYGPTMRCICELPTLWNSQCPRCGPPLPASSSLLLMEVILLHAPALGTPTPALASQPTLDSPLPSALLTLGPAPFRRSNSLVTRPPPAPPCPSVPSGPLTCQCSSQSQAHGNICGAGVRFPWSRWAAFRLCQ